MRKSTLDRHTDARCDALATLRAELRRSIERKSPDSMAGIMAALESLTEADMGRVLAEELFRRADMEAL